MKKITRAELLALFGKSSVYIEERLGQDYVDGVLVFERQDGYKHACVFGAPYTIKRWQDAEGKPFHVGYGKPQTAIAYYEKPHDRDEAQASSV